MKQIPIIKVNGHIETLLDIDELYADDTLDKIMGHVKAELEKRGLYHEHLMYRGVAVDEDQLQSILANGTDKTDEGEIDMFLERRERIEDSSCYGFDDDRMFDDLLSDMREYHLERRGRNFTDKDAAYYGELVSEHLEEEKEVDMYDNKSPDNTWLLPEGEAGICVMRYAINRLDEERNIPVLLVYEPGAFLRVGGKLNGKEIKDIPSWSVGLEEDAVYKFKDDVKPIDALVAVIRLDG